MYIGTALARHGLSSVQGGRRTPPGAPALGVYKSTDGGGTWSLVRVDVSTPKDISGECDARTYSYDTDPEPLRAPDLADCKRLLSAVPSKPQSLDDGLDTLQFQSLSVSPTNPRRALGGTQDNGDVGVQRLSDVDGDGGRRVVDTRKPEVTLAVGGRGRRLNFGGDVVDPGGIARVRISFGDGSARALRPGRVGAVAARHRYRRTGSFTVRLEAHGPQRAPRRGGRTGAGPALDFTL